MSTNNTHYTVLSYNINDYEILHTIHHKSERARYIMVVDKPCSGDTNGWEVVVDESLSGTAIDKCYQVRYNPFRYTDDDIVVRIDGSIGINESLDALVDRFISTGADTSLMVHPSRNTLYDEYVAWCQLRSYPVQNAGRVMEYLNNMEGYDVKGFKGLVQMGFQILKRNEVNERVNLMTYAWLKMLGDKGDIERVDQAIYTFIVSKYFNLINIMWVDQRMIQSDYLTIYPHHCDVPYDKVNVKDMIEPYFFNKRLHNVVRPQDL